LVSPHCIVTKADGICELKVVGLTLVTVANSVLRPGIVENTVVVIT
jgi:hypothetical protein